MNPDPGRKKDEPQMNTELRRYGGAKVTDEYAESPSALICANHRLDLFSLFFAFIRVHSRF
jgi:hypothetical protein